MTNSDPYLGPLRPRGEWQEDDGAALWWRFPIVEPPYVGSLLDSDPLPDGVTHWQRIETPSLDPLTVASSAREDLWARGSRERAFLLDLVRAFGLSGLDDAHIPDLQVVIAERAKRLPQIADKAETLKRPCAYGCATHSRQKQGDTLIVYQCSCGMVQHNEEVDALVRLAKGLA